MQPRRVGIVHTDEHKSGRSRGFTLIELLTVIFIIGLLAAILIPSVSKVRERANRAAVAADLRSVSTSLSDYQIDSLQGNGSFPPKAGCPMRYFVEAQINDAFPSPQYEMNELWKSYLARCELIGADVGGNFYDRFSRSEDLNRSQRVQVPYSDPGEALAEDRPTRFTVDPIAGFQVFTPPNGIIDRGKVAYQYFPVNSNNIGKFRQILSVMVQGNEDDVYANRPYTMAELTNPRGELDIDIEGLTLPAQRYDRFVLLSLGPVGSDQGIVPRNADNPDDLRLRAFYRATRDLDNNQILDFDFNARSKRLETFPLPDGSTGYGVIILSGP